jgi:hypothetical protein
MNPVADRWTEMLNALVVYRKAHGHCNVPAQFKANPRLGRWVAAQRYRHKVGELSPAEIIKLNKLGFVWSATELKWNQMFERLVVYKKKHGHCNVSCLLPGDADLGSWVSRQRVRKKNGKLSADRLARLNGIGFRWSVYKEEGHQASTPAPEKIAVKVEERLYHIGAGGYVQYNGHGSVPLELKRYLAHSDGQFPAFIQLPGRPVMFVMGTTRVAWSGKGIVSQRVIEYVNETGTLPEY